MLLIFCETHTVLFIQSFMVLERSRVESRILATLLFKYTAKAYLPLKLGNGWPIVSDQL